jgi:hypothetical protein
MSGDDEGRMSDGMAGLGIADGACGGDAAVSEVSAAPTGSPSLNIPGAALLSGAGRIAGSSKGGESVVVVTAPLVAQTSCEVICAAGARLAVLSAERAALPVPPKVDMHDGSAEMPARHSLNRQWLNVVISYAKDWKYDGLSIVPQTVDQKTRFEYYKYHVGAVIRVCQGPRHDEASIDMVES